MEKSVAEEEKDVLISLSGWEDILEKKSKIYSRLLTDPALAKAMEECSFRHEKRKEELLTLAFGKSAKKQNGQDRYASNEGDEEK